MLDAAGKDWVVIETVGVGQDEIDIVRTADIAIVVLVPGTGDEVQALKAGIMEIADVFVVNKADREGADRLAASIEGMLALGEVEPGAWRPPIVRTQATAGTGVPDLLAAIEAFRAHTASAQHERRRLRQEFRLRELLADRFMEHVDRHVLAAGELDGMLERIADRRPRPLCGRERDPGAGPRKERDIVKATLDHIGIAVADLSEALAFYRDALGLDVEPPEEVPSQRVRAHFVPVGEAAIELLEPTSPDSPIAKFIAKRGPGVHHVTLRVDDIRETLGRLKARGVRLIDEAPREGAEGALVAFIHPASTHGVLVELKQRLKD